MIFIKGMRLKAYLISKVKPKDGHWLWQAAIGGAGYGVFNCGGITVSAHRKSYECFVGSIPDGLDVLHTCDCRACINPAHLYLGTDQTNSDDKVSRGRQAKGTTHGMSKLSEDDILQIRDLYKTGTLGQYELADLFGVNQGAISRIVNHKSYK